jgi:ribosomal protein S18 acetylase RimI-like enzyme
MKIRRARRADFDALLEIEGEAFRTDRLTRRKLVHLTTRGNASLLVAEKRGRIVGYALLLFRRGTKSARLYGLAVAASERGRGLGRRLLAAAEEEARRQRRSVVSLETDPRNVAALNVYINAGYRCVARLGPYYEDGSPADRYARMIDAPGP